MTKKMLVRFRRLIFALIMSCSTSLIVSTIIIKMRTQNFEQFIEVWPSSFLMSWPIVFLSISIIAPLVDKLLDRLIASK